MRKKIKAAIRLRAQYRPKFMPRHKVKRVALDLFKGRRYRAEEKLKLTDLPDVRDSDPLQSVRWCMNYVPVMSTAHLPRDEGAAISVWLSRGMHLPTQLFMTDPGDSCVLLTGLREDEADYEGFPVLSGILRTLYKKGYLYLRVDPDGYTFADLPLFDWDELY